MKSNRKSRFVYILVLWFCGLSQAGEAIIKPGIAVDYNQIVIYPKRWEELEVDKQLIPWSGEEVVFLTTKKDLDCEVMTLLLGRLDGAWRLYAELTGRRPGFFKQLNGKPTIIAVPNGRLTCGYGCGYVGATGVEVAGFYNKDYPLLKSQPDAMPHYYFYEMGRNFYTFGDRHSLFVTGFAVFMRYVCMDAFGFEDPDLNTRQTIEIAEQLYAKSDMGFLKAFTTLDGLDEKAHRLKNKEGKTIVPSDQPVLYASAMLKIRRVCGGDKWLKRFFRQLAGCPEIKPKSKDAAVRQSLNWLVSASCAANKDMSAIFVDHWRLPLVPETRRALSQITWADPNIEASRVLKKLGVDKP